MINTALPVSNSVYHLNFTEKITFNIVIIIFPLNALVTWQRGLGANLPSRWFRFDSLLSCFLLCCINLPRFVLFFFFVFNHTVFSSGLVSLY